MTTACCKCDHLQRIVLSVSLEGLGSSVRYFECLEGQTLLQLSSIVFVIEPDLSVHAVLSSLEVEPPPWTALAKTLLSQCKGFKGEVQLRIRADSMDHMDETVRLALDNFILNLQSNMGVKVALDQIALSTEPAKLQTFFQWCTNF